MAEYRATIDWKRGNAPFKYETYPRNHVLRFEGGIEVPASAATHNIPASAAGAPGVDPEQAFVGSISSCHMLWFLHIASKAGFVVDGYLDEASGVMEKNGEGRIAVTRVTLRPAVRFSGKAPTPAEHEKLHHEAHEECFIANSVKSEVRCEPGIA